MKQKERKLLIGALLCDVDKLVTGAGKVEENFNETNDPDIQECLKYTKNDSVVQKQSPACLIKVSEKWVSEAISGVSKNFEPGVPMGSIFDILNGNHGNSYYKAEILKSSQEINNPEPYVTKGKQYRVTPEFYRKITEKLNNYIKQNAGKWQDESIRSLLSILEAYTSSLPYSSKNGVGTDISIYDHVKMTAAYSICLNRYLEDQGKVDYYAEIIEKEESFRNKKAFLLFSMDVSGIQKFIYTIHSDGALRMLRSRSFYLEIMMEHMIDEILETLDLTRVNLIYSGGGHCYILMPNTKDVQEKLGRLEKQFKEWFLKQFDVALYVAKGLAECSVNDLQNIPKGSYSEVFRTVSAEISEKKAKRYSADDILYLNRRKHHDDTRECRVCKRSDAVNEDGICTFCEKLGALSKDILNKKFFTVLNDAPEGLPLPNGRYLIAQTDRELQESMRAEARYIRTYGKNEFFDDNHIATKLWIGDYVKTKISEDGRVEVQMTTDDYAKAAKGIDRIAVLRADVDNLGKAFVSGFSDPYTTLSRTAAFSRHLSLFFKHHINTILKKGGRKVAIVYSGGDDLFLVGSWDDIIAAAIDIEEALKKYTLGTLSISAGIGIYPAKYPLSVCASEVEELEDESKKYPDSQNPSKNAVTLMGETYSWNEFTGKVLGEKLKALRKFFNTNDERGMAFLYRLLELIRGRDEKINIARFAYILARLEPNDSKKKAVKEAYRDFARQMYLWIQNKEDSRELVTAIYIYVYERRGGEEG